MAPRRPERGARPIAAPISGRRPAGLIRRSVASLAGEWTVYACCLAVLYLLIALVSDEPSEVFVLRELYDSVLADRVLLLLLLAELCDKVVGLAVLGRTTAQWLGGYRIVDKQGERPSWWQAVVRLLAWGVELCTLGVPSLFLGNFRTDKATLHDLVSGTRAVLEERPEMFRGRRTARLALPALAAFYAYFFLVHLVYEIKVLPVEDRMVEEGIYPRWELMARGSSETDVVFQSLRLARARQLELEACALSEPDPPERFQLLLDGQVFEGRYRTREREVFSFLPIGWQEYLEEEADWLETTFHVVSALAAWSPFMDASHVRAAEASVHGPPNFQLFTPIRNTAMLLSKIGWVLNIPNDEKARVERVVRSNPNATALITRIQRNGFAILEASFTADGAEFHLELFGKGDGAPLDRIFHELALARAEAPAVAACEGPVRFTWEPSADSER